MKDHLPCEDWLHVRLPKIVTNSLQERVVTGSEDMSLLKPRIKWRSTCFPWSSCYESCFLHWLVIWDTNMGGDPAKLKYFWRVKTKGFVKKWALGVGHNGGRVSILRVHILETPTSKYRHQLCCQYGWIETKCMRQVYTLEVPTKYLIPIIIIKNWIL